MALEGDHAAGARPASRAERRNRAQYAADGRCRIPQVAQTYGPSWHFFGRYQNDSFHDGQAN